MPRQAPKFKQQAKYHVICEDSKSSKTYLNEAFNYHRVNNYIQAIHIGNTDPLGIVQAAIKACKTYDKVYCVIDRDEHANFDVAVQTAKSNDKVVLIVSYPCYELWFLLHCGYKRKSYARAGRKSAADLLIADLQASHDLFKNYSKGDSTSGMYKKILNNHSHMFDAALKHAEQLLNEVEADGEINPSTKFHTIFEVIKSLLKPQKVEKDNIEVTS